MELFLAEKTPGLLRGDTGMISGAFGFFNFFSDFLGDYQGITSGAYQKTERQIKKQIFSWNFVANSNNYMKNIESMTPKIQLRAYSKKEVAVLYEVSIKTLKTWLIPSATKGKDG